VKTIQTKTKDSQYWKRVPVGTLLRVRDEDAQKIVDNNEGKYVPKSAWKELRNNETNHKEGK